MCSLLQGLHIGLNLCGNLLKVHHLLTATQLVSCRQNCVSWLHSCRVMLGEEHATTDTSATTIS